MAVETLPPPASAPPSALDRSLPLLRLNWELAAYSAIIALSIVAHLWGLGRMAMHHDESIHAWSSWRFYTGAGGFNCWSGLDENGQSRGGVTAPTYCYDPVYHGPSLYFLTAFAYFLFGDGDAQARLPMAVAGILMVASAWWLRPYLGRGGALMAALLLGFSPSLLYYTRFARHDGLMVLWEVWMLIGALRWLDSGRASWLYLCAAGVALAIGTHELYYILFFIFGVFVFVRLMYESRFASYLGRALLAVMAICVPLMIFNPPLPVGRGLYLGEKAFLVAAVLLLAWLCQRLWEPQPFLVPRLRQLWQDERPTLVVALGILGGIYLVLYTTLFAYPRGAIDGLYAGLAYWLGSQQDYARGDQPWYYYLIQLPLYEPLAVIAGLGTCAAMGAAVARRVLAARRAAAPDAAAYPLDVDATLDGDPADDTAPALTSNPRPLIPDPQIPPPWPLFPLLLTFWFFSALILFSWAGEKMPWLVVHMALPGNLLAAWALARLGAVVVAHSPRAAATSTTMHLSLEEPSAPKPRLPWLGLVPLATALGVAALAVAFWRLGQPSTGQGGQSNMLQAIIPLLIAGGLIYGLLTLASQLGGRLVLALTGLTFAALLGAYTLRATWMSVYEHPDTPVELLVYTQTSPDVPRYVADVRELAINLTRSQRNAQDAVGGLTMPVFLDSGDSAGEGSLAWPLQWYLRDFKNLNWIKKDTYQTNPTAQTFEVQMPDGSTALAPVVMLYRPYVTEQVRAVLSDNYAQPYGPSGIFNWWFPEGDKCSPQSPGYKRFYYSTWNPPSMQDDAGGNGPCGRDLSAELSSPLAPLSWPFRPANWDTLYKFLIYRQLASPLTPGAREMEVWLRKDLVSGFGEDGAAGSASPELRLVAQQVITLPAGSNGPTGVAVDGQGSIYVADTSAHRVHVFNEAGELLRSFGGLGNELGKLYEPRGLVVDAQGNLYVADTWNARIVKYNPQGEPIATWGSGEQDLGDGRRATITDGTTAGNQAKPLGFFGPRGLALDGKGNVYIADTGNKRIVVTDTEGNYKYQWGAAGADLGLFNEPTGVAIDGKGNVYVSDTWNGRVQVFADDGSGQVSPIPVVTWNVSGWRPNTYDDPSIVASSTGDIYASVPARQQVVAANLRGDVLLRWGGAGDDLASLNSPSGMAVAPDGSVWVVDRSSNRLLRFALPAVQVSQ